MVYIKEAGHEINIEKIKETTRNGNEGILITVNDGYFEYWFPIVEAPDYMKGHDKMLGINGKSYSLEIKEAPGQENETTHDGSSPLTIPQKVADKAEQHTGLQFPE